MTNPTLERAARALCRAVEEKAWHGKPDEEMDRIVDSYWPVYAPHARAVLMAVLPTLERYDSDYAGEYQDDRGDYVKYADLQAILNDGEGSDAVV